MSLKRLAALLPLLIALVTTRFAAAQTLPLVEKVEAQPLVAQARRVVEEEVEAWATNSVTIFAERVLARLGGGE